MTHVLATVLLLCQLRPVMAVAACMTGSHAATECEMTDSSRAVPARGGSPDHSSTPMPSCECPAMPLCGVGTAVILSSIARQEISPPAGLAVAPSAPDVLHTADPIAPPVPPPNA